MVARLDRTLVLPPAQPPGPGLLAGAFGVLVLFLAAPHRPPEQERDLSEPLGHPVQRGPGDHEHAEPGQQGQQRDRGPRGQQRLQRRGDREAEQAARGLHGGHAGRRTRAAQRDMHDAERPGQERRPADDHPAGVRVLVRMPQQPPGQQAEQDRKRPGAETEGAADQPGETAADRRSEPEPGGPGRDHRERQHGQPGPVPAVRGIQLAGAVAEQPGRVADTARDLQPHGRDHRQQPADQDQERILRRSHRGGQAAPRRHRPAAAPGVRSAAPGAG